MNISSIADSIGSISKNQVNPLNKVENKTNEASFNSMLKDAMSEVNNHQVEGYKAMEGIATGNVKNLQEAVQKIERS